MRRYALLLLAMLLLLSACAPAGVPAAVQDQITDLSRTSETYPQDGIVLRIEYTRPAVGWDYIREHATHFIQAEVIGIGACSLGADDYPQTEVFLRVDEVLIGEKKDIRSYISIQRPCGTAGNIARGLASSDYDMAVGDKLCFFARAEKTYDDYTTLVIPYSCLYTPTDEGTYACMHLECSSLCTEDPQTLQQLKDAFAGPSDLQ